MHYINYYFTKLAYDGQIIEGKFSAPDFDVRCSFIFYRDTQETIIKDSNKAAEEILPLPIHWLLYKLHKHGILNENESKISY